jgi:hypothetical protein
VEGKSLEVDPTREFVTIRWLSRIQAPSMTCIGSARRESMFRNPRTPQRMREPDVREKASGNSCDSRKRSNTSLMPGGDCGHMPPHNHSLLKEREPDALQHLHPDQRMLKMLK